MERGRKQSNESLAPLTLGKIGSSPPGRETHDSPLPKKEIFRRGHYQRPQFIGRIMAMGSRFVQLQDLNANQDDLQCIRSIGYLTAYNWKQEIAQFTHKSHSIQIKTTFYGPFEFQLGTPMHFIAQRSEGTPNWTGFVFVPAVGIALEEFLESMKRPKKDETLVY